jgi:hypothetical protein
MATASNVDRIRQAALESADRSERNFFRFIWSVAFLELLIATIYVLMAVFGFSVPVLIGVAGACVYTLMAAGLYGLKLHIDASTSRIISALRWRSKSRRT